MSLVCDDVPAGVENLASDALTLYSENGILYIGSPTPQQVNIYAADGHMVNRMLLHEGTNTVALPQGLYLVGRQKVVVY